MADDRDDLFVAPDEAALIIEPDGELRLILPEHLEDDEAHPFVALLAVVATKFGDPEWVAGMLKEYEGQKLQ